MITLFESNRTDQTYMLVQERLKPEGGHNLLFSVHSF